MNRTSYMNQQMNCRCPANRPMTESTACRMNRASQSNNSCQVNQAPRNDSSCQMQRETGSDIPTGSRQQLLDYINHVSFATIEAQLFLDTHPTNPDALQFFHQHNRKRNAALKEHERLYGPLTIETANESCSRSWEWMQQPWPWEGGAC